MVIQGVTGCSLVAITDCDTHTHIRIAYGLESLDLNVSLCVCVCACQPVCLSSEMLRLTVNYCYT